MGAVTGAGSVISKCAITLYLNLCNYEYWCFFVSLLLKKDGQYKENISDLSGISKKHPVLAISLLIILFSLAGVPAFRGFAKFYVFVAVLEQQMYTLAIIGLVTTVMSHFIILK